MSYKKEHYQQNKARYAESSLAFRRRNPWYDSWKDAKRRCEDRRSMNYAYYGAKGIQFFLTREEAATLWRRDNGHLLKQPSIDREDPAGHYVFDNCRFIELEDNLKRRWQKPVKSEETEWE